MIKQFPAGEDIRVGDLVVIRSDHKAYRGNVVLPGGDRRRASRLRILGIALCRAARRKLVNVLMADATLHR